jgi:2-polyprenyl-3-methyl-5-hydroxy-6-metoxy-1,4-benzoquinol methylase
MEKNAYTEMFSVEDKHWWYVGLHDLVTTLVKQSFPPKKLKILYAGCGTGGLISILSNLGHTVDGIDYSEDAVGFCKERGLNQVIKADINDWIPKPGYYDLIVSMDVLCHKWVLDEIKVLESMARGLNEGGLVMLNYPAFPVLARHHDKVVMIRERYTKRTLQGYLFAAGLVPVLLSYRLPHAFLFLLLLRTYEESKRNATASKSDIAEIPPGFINEILIGVNRLENRMIAGGIPIPMGSSLFAVAKRI